MKVGHRNSPLYHFYTFLIYVAPYNEENSKQDETDEASWQQWHILLLHLSATPNEDCERHHARSHYIPRGVVADTPFTNEQEESCDKDGQEAK